MKVIQTNITGSELRNSLKEHGITFRSIEAKTIAIGMNGGAGFSYSYVRKVLVSQTRKSEEIINLANKMITAQQAANRMIAA